MSRNNVSLLLLFVATIVIIAPGNVLADDHSSDVSVEITANKLKYKPDTVTVSPGEKVTVTMKNEGFVSHSFDIPELDIHTPSVQPDSFVRTTFTPEKEGEYQFICDVAQHKKAGMKGNLVVRESNN